MTTALKDLKALQAECHKAKSGLVGDPNEAWDDAYALAKYEVTKALDPIIEKLEREQADKGELIGRLNERLWKEYQAKAGAGIPRGSNSRFFRMGSSPNWGSSGIPRGGEVICERCGERATNRCSGALWFCDECFTIHVKEHHPANPPASGIVRGFDKNGVRL